MFKHKANYIEHILNPVFLRAVSLHFNDREYKVENQYIYFDYDIKKDEIFLAQWNMLQLVEVYL